MISLYIPRSDIDVSYCSSIFNFLRNLHIVFHNVVAAAKSLQSCLTLCNPIDCSLPGSSVHEDSPGKNTGAGCHTLLQGIFPSQGLNPGLLHCRWILYSVSHQGSPDPHLFMPSQTKSEFAIALWSCGFACFLPSSLLPSSLGLRSLATIPRGPPRQ